MAYIAFDADGAHATLEACRNTETVVDFTRQEWLAIEVARRDGPHAGQAPSRIARLMNLLLGVRIANPLADLRLETLRQAAVHLWHRGTALDDRLTGAMREQGYDLCHIALLTQFIATGSARTA